ncbi:helix-turn-helix domain-containing protein [Hymenobacter lapidarius]|uniref:helix-turn-helix domain-containing protein n=1 Tax=Hymenobacter lapidarius TaxID=1908237 RepID=UPI001300F6AA|nr:helix-turn-helix transcriptional regulator [Hymenobacter lapidarius]
MRQIADVKNEAGIQAFGAHLQRLREARGWSREVLAQSADVSRMTVYRIEKAQLAASLDVFLSLAHALEISPRELMDFPNSNK